MSKQPNKCLYPKCKLKARSRGLCASHYANARNLVVRKGWKWAELEKAGKAMPTGSEFTKWLRGEK